MAYKDETWREQAACRGKVHLLKILFLEPGAYSKATRKQIADLCGPCPVREQCLQYAEDNNITHGTYGGMSPRQRRDAAWHRRRELLERQGRNIYDYQ